MHHTMILTDEELEVLQQVVSSEISESRTELRHTKARDFRARVQRHIEVTQQISDKIGFLCAGMGESYAT